MRNFVKINFILCVSSILLSAEKNVNAQDSVSYNYSTNAVQTWTVPSCVTQVTIQMWGAGGGSGYMSTYYDAFSGGSGGYISGVLSGSTLPGQILSLYVPQGGGYSSTSSADEPGGWPGGGNGGNDDDFEEYGGGGGGYAAVQIGSTYYAIAGGGGGGGSTSYGGTAYGGGGGADTGSAGVTTLGTSGGGGTPTSGGFGGSGDSYNGLPGSYLTGGTGEPLSADGNYGGGGGGGGYYGGGGGGDIGNSGGGGSSYPDNTFVSGGITFTILLDSAGTLNSNTFGSAIAPGSPPYGIGYGNIANVGGNGYITIKWLVDSVSTVTGNVVSNVSCYDGSDAKASAITTGALASTLIYSWSPSGQTTDTATILSAGTYTVTVYSYCGLPKTATVTITQPTVLTASASVLNSVSCYGGNNGVAFCSAGGGTTPYTYLWTGGGGTDLTAVGLTAGIYKVTVTDNNGCIAQSSVTITQPNMLVTNTTATANANCGINTGSATSTVGGGTTPYDYSWSNGVSNSTVSGLSGGTYILTVTDNNGCSTTSSVSIMETPAVSVSASTLSNITCNGNNIGSAASTITGGTAPFEYLWSDGGGTNFTAAGLSAGTYTITVTDNNGCSNTASTTITQPAAINIITDSTAADNGCSGSAWVIVSGGVSPYNYLWSNGNTTDYISDECRGAYCCTITDANGCRKEVCVNISSTTGIDNISANASAVTLYPNPTTGIVNGKLLMVNENTQVEIYNVLGEKKYSNTFTSYNSQFTIDLSSNPDGIYLYRVLTQSGNLLGEGKIVLQK